MRDATCPNCGETVDEDADDRCPQCSIPLHVTCPTCGETVAEAEDDCPRCGASLAHAAEGA